MNEIEQYYNKFNEDKRLLSRHGRVEFYVTYTYIQRHLSAVLDERKCAKSDIKIMDIGAGTGAYCIPLADEGMKDFQKIARKYGVDFAIVKDKNQNPPIYTVFFKAKDMDAITRILQDYSAKQVKKASVEKTSVLEKLKKFKEIVAAIPRKVAEKKKERSR